MKPKEIDIPVWWKYGNGGMIRRSALPHDHKESEYNYIKETLKLIPEEYGVYKDMTEYNEVNQKKKSELVSEVMELREQLRAYEKAGF